MSKRESTGKKPPKQGRAKEQQPLLSVAIIFKNEIRCLERCLKSLQPLRDRIPMEVVMADTGSDDGSREIAEKYADILFDFPWIDDFAAARNAVIDRCSGVWCISVDCDEWLDGDIGELVDVVTLPGLRGRYWVGALRMLNYCRPDLRGGYGEFMAMRLFLRSSGLRYEGAIHEHLTCPGSKLLALDHTVLHHDGYVSTNNGSPDGKTKRERNIKLLREALEKAPNDLRLLMQSAESAEGEEREEYIRRGVEAVRAKARGWEGYGPPIYRNAIQRATAEKWPEITEWSGQALELFPDSLFIRVDVNYVLFASAFQEGEIRRAIPLGERYLAELTNYRETGDPSGQMTTNCLYYSGPAHEHFARLQLAVAYHKEKRDGEAAAALAATDPAPLMPADLDRLYSLITEIQEGEDAPDMAPAWAKFGKGLSALAAEDSDLGRAATLLDTEDPAELSALLATIEDWKEVPGFALAHALLSGAAFPIPGRDLKSEDLAALAARLPKKQRVELACRYPRLETAREICWADALVLSAVNGYGWKEDSEESSRLARAFAEAERAWLPLCYAPGALRPEDLFLLPPSHRFGFHCVRAFQAADQGDELGYVRALRQGLEQWSGAKDMVEFLMDHRPASRSTPSPELLALAKQVRAVLSRFAPGDPAVAALKASPAYQRVAHLVEEAPAG